MTFSSSRASATDSQLSKHLTVLADLGSQLQPQSASLGQYEFVQGEDSQLSAGCGLESELLERLLKQNMIVLVADDPETDETIFRRDEVSNLIEQLVDCLTAASIKAKSSFIYIDFYLRDVLVVRGLEAFVKELVGVPLVPS